MLKGIRRSTTGLALSVLVSVPPSVVSFAQTSLAQTSPAQTSPAQTPFPPEGPSSTIAPGQGSATTIAPAQAELAYTLGPGDLIRIDVYETPELVLESRYTVLLDGTVNLPWVGAVSVRGKSLSEAKAALQDSYRSFVRNPLITVSLIAPRSLKIGVIGEVNRPGSYILNPISSEASQSSLAQRSGSESGTQWPTVSRALQSAGGITQIANVGEVRIRRPGQPQDIRVNLLSFLNDGDLSQDTLLRDGDAIYVPKADSLTAAQATQIAASNFSPELIKVNVVGEVNTPGAVPVKPNITLNQAILAAGGLKNNRARRSNVELIRLEPNGTVTRRVIALDFSKNLDDKSNPPLRNNDVVIVDRNAFTKFTDTLTQVLSPLNGVFGLFTVLGLGR